VCGRAGVWGRGSDSCPPIDGWVISHHLPAIPAAVRSSLTPESHAGQSLMSKARLGSSGAFDTGAGDNWPPKTRATSTSVPGLQRDVVSHSRSAKSTRCVRFPGRIGLLSGPQQTAKRESSMTRSDFHWLRAVLDTPRTTGVQRRN